MQGADIRVIQRRNRPRLPFESGRELLVSHFDRYGAPQSRVYRTEDLTHAALAKFALDTVRAKAIPHGDCRDSHILKQFRRVLRRWLVQKLAACPLREKRFQFAAQFGIYPSQERRALLRICLANGVV